MLPDLGRRKGRAGSPPLLPTTKYLLLTNQYFSESLYSFDVFPNCAANASLTFATLSADEVKVILVLTTADENDDKIG